MPKKSTDPFMANLWSALVADKLGPGGHETGWDETPVRIRNRFIRAVRPVLGSGAAFAASLTEPGASGNSGGGQAPPRAGKKARGKRHDPRELHLPLMASVRSGEEPAKSKTAARKPRR